MTSRSLLAKVVQHYFPEFLFLRFLRHFKKNIYFFLPYCTTGSGTLTVKDIPECSTFSRILELLYGHNALEI